MYGKIIYSYKTAPIIGAIFTWQNNYFFKLFSLLLKVFILKILFIFLLSSFDFTVINNSSKADNKALTHNITPVTLTPNNVYKTGVVKSNKPVILFV